MLTEQTRPPRVLPLQSEIEHRFWVAPSNGIYPLDLKHTYILCAFMMQLIAPNILHKSQWEAIISEWGGSRKRPRIFFQTSYEVFLERVKRVKDHDDYENQTPRSSIFFLQKKMQGQIVGFFCLRHNLTMRDDEIYSGHIGYGIRPTERGKGFAKGGLKLLLLEAERIGMGRVLITCDDDNIGSWKVIEANGGAFERYIYNNEGTKRRRYCIQLN